MVQAAMRQLLDLKGSAKLPDEVQWSIRMLLPKPGLAAGSAQQVAAVHAGGDGTGIQNALAVLAEHAQQVYTYSIAFPSNPFRACEDGLFLG